MSATIVNMTFNKRRSSRAGFTMVEALVAITITALAGSVLFMGISASLQTTNAGMYGLIAQGMAQQLMDEIIGNRYCELGVSPYQYPLGVGPGETTRQLYDDIDDYNGLRVQPPKDFYSVALGTENGEGSQRNPLFFAPSGFFANWKQEVDVYYVSPTDMQTKLTAGQTSDYRVVEVRIIYNDPSRGARTLACLKRVVTYVPFMQ
jgi:type II secretory pathway pseudopilin PulG